MSQQIYLLNLTISGIKNIEKEITLHFYKKTIDKNFNIDDYRVKAIYGENGSGKTGIVLAVHILKNLLLDPNYLGDSANQRFLREVINKKSRRLFIESEYYLVNSNIYKYAICIEQNEVGNYEIVKEQLHKRSSAYPTSKYIELFSIDKTVLKCDLVNEEQSQQLQRITTNLLPLRTLGTIVLKSNEFVHTDLELQLTLLYVFALQLVTSFDGEDRPDEKYVRKTLQTDNLDSDRNVEKRYPKVDSFNGDKRIVNKNHIKEYEQEVRKLEKFLKLFKSDLKRIDIDKKESKDAYECSLILDYGDYRVSTEFESTGINKLIRLFDYLSLAMNDNIVFVDEMDSNINDIYFCKLVEYFVKYGRGQLCFTTHNTSPMAVLRHNKNSIDFLSNDNRVIPWRKNGNFAPENLYRHGMIEYLPFNIEAEDFLGILGD